MEDLSYLAGLSELEFEAERCRIIKQYLDNLPPDRRKKAQALQMQLDVERSTSTPEVFLASLVGRIRENVENMEDQALAMQHALGHRPT